MQPSIYTKEVNLSEQGEFWRRNACQWQTSKFQRVEADSVTQVKQKLPYTPDMDLIANNLFLHTPRSI